MGDAAGQAADRLHPLGLGEPGLERSLVGYVASDGDRAEDRAAGFVQRRDGHVDVDRGAVDPLQLEASSPAFAPKQSRGHVLDGLRGAQVAQQVRISPNDLRCGVAGHIREGAIDVGDVPAAIGGEDRLGRLVHGRRQMFALYGGHAGPLSGGNPQPGDDQDDQQPGGRDMLTEHIEIVPVAEGRSYEGHRESGIWQPRERARVVGQSCRRPAAVLDPPLKVRGEREPEPGRRVEDSGRPSRRIDTSERFVAGDHVGEEDQGQ